MSLENNLPAAFDTRAMLEVVEVIPPAPGMFKELFFTTRNVHETEKVEIELVRKGKKIFAFVTNVEGGKLVDRSRRSKQTHACPRLRPKDVFGAPELLNRTAPGESPYINNPNALTPEQRVEKKIVEQLIEFDEGVERTIEWMCSKIATTGKLVVTQDNISFEIDFLMPDGNRVVLTGDALWSAAGMTIFKAIAQFEDWATNLIGENSGLPADILMLGTNAWNALFGMDGFLDLLDNRRIDLGHLSPMIAKSYKGTIGGLDIYVNSDKYEDDDGNMQPLLHPDYALMGSSLCGASIEFGLPQDLDHQGPMEFFAKSYIEKDPSKLMLVGESDPLPNPKNSGAFCYIKVL